MLYHIKIRLKIPMSIVKIKNKITAQTEENTTCKSRQNLQVVCNNFVEMNTYSVKINIYLLLKYIYNF